MNSVIKLIAFVGRYFDRVSVSVLFDRTSLGCKEEELSYILYTEDYRGHTCGDTGRINGCGGTGISDFGCNSFAAEAVARDCC